MKEDRSRWGRSKQGSIDRESECRHCRSPRKCRPEGAGKTIWFSLELPFSRLGRARINPGSTNLARTIGIRKHHARAGFEVACEAEMKTLATVRTPFEVRQNAPMDSQLWWREYPRAGVIANQTNTLSTPLEGS